jgi:hypothetical protein
VVVRLRRLIVVAIALALAAVGGGWAIFEVSESFVLPVIPYISHPGAALLLILGPAAATIAFGLAWRQSALRCVGASVLCASLVVLFSWVSWVAAIILYCGVLGHACFD